MEAEAIEAAKAAAELNIMGGLASVTGVQSPAPTRTAGATAQNNDAAMGNSTRWECWRKGSTGIECRGV